MSARLDEKPRPIANAKAGPADVPRRRRRFGALFAALAVVAAAGPIQGQTLYALLESPAELRVLDREDASTLATLGTVTHPDVIALARGIALDPTSGDLYAILFVSGGGSRVFGRLSLSATFTQIAELTGAIRDLTFDGSGKLWAVVGNIDPNANDLVSIDVGTGQITLENGALPTTGRNKIAYVPETDTLYLLGDTAGPWELYSFSPSNPALLTQVPLSGVVLDDTSSPPMVYDPVSQVLRTQDTGGNWMSITLAGVVTQEAPFPGYNLGGLALDPRVFADGFESGDTAAWSSASP